MGSADPLVIRVPVGENSDRWASRTTSCRVLLVMHNVTSAGRLLDVLPLFHDDFRVQLLATSTESSAFQARLPLVTSQARVHLTRECLPAVRSGRQRRLTAHGPSRKGAGRQQQLLAHLAGRTIAYRSKECGERTERHDLQHVGPSPGPRSDPGRTLPPQQRLK